MILWWNYWFLFVIFLWNWHFSSVIFLWNGCFLSVNFRWNSHVLPGFFDKIIVFTAILSQNGFSSVNRFTKSIFLHGHLTKFVIISCAIMLKFDNFELYNRQNSWYTCMTNFKNLLLVFTTFWWNLNFSPLYFIVCNLDKICGLFLSSFNIFFINQVKIITICFWHIWQISWYFFHDCLKKFSFFPLAIFTS